MKTAAIAIVMVAIIVMVTIMVSDLSLILWEDGSVTINGCIPTMECSK
jgi:hypothetical protein